MPFFYLVSSSLHDGIQSVVLCCVMSFMYPLLDAVRLVCLVVRFFLSCKLLISIRRRQAILFKKWLDAVLELGTTATKKWVTHHSVLLQAVFPHLFHERILGLRCLLHANHGLRQVLTLTAPTCNIEHTRRRMPSCNWMRLMRPLSFTACLAKNLKAGDAIPFAISEPELKAVCEPQTEPSSA